VYQLRQTEVFAAWLAGLRDVKAQARILARLESARLGNLGDCKAIGAGLREMRIHIGAGYRVYFVQKKEVILVLLCGGSKSSQTRDITRAKKIAQELKDEGNG
jgi:putative addiction module killer protein